MAASTITKEEKSPPSLTPEDAANLIPGTTVPQQLSREQSSEIASTFSPPEKTSFPGPQVNGQQTTITIYSPEQLKDAPFIPSFVEMMNSAFSWAHEQSNTFPATGIRMRSADQYYAEIGNDPSSFNYLLTYTGTDTVVAACAAMRWWGHVNAVIKLPDGTERISAFRRVGFPDEAAEIWELRHLAVDPGAQKQGLAGLLMGLCEDEVKRRFRGVNEGVEGKRKLIMYLTTMKETNEAFYSRKGYAADAQFRYDIGYMDTRSPFTVLHMSKMLDEIK